MRENSESSKFVFWSKQKSVVTACCEWMDLNFIIVLHFDGSRCHAHVHNIDSLPIVKESKILNKETNRSADGHEAIAKILTCLDVCVDSFSILLESLANRVAIVHSEGHTMILVIHNVEGDRSLCI
jgi:hypothetical protein